MWLLQFLFFSITLLLAWILFGYFLILWCIGRFKKHDPPAAPDEWPSFSIIVPCYNEADRIMEKLNDLRRLDYPDGVFEIFFVDGGSDDNTTELLLNEIKANEKIRVISCPRRGKIHQLNHVLPLISGTIVVNTDVDACLSANILKDFAAEFSSGNNVWVVGAYCRPKETIDVERYYWSAQNKGRFLESDAGTTSIVIAQCYAFRKALLKAFPDDVIADDIYLAFLANTLGYRTVYSQNAMAFETRSPASYQEFLPHKFRKNNAFLREALRFLYRLPEMSPFVKMMLLTRTSQLLLLPWVILFWILLACSLVTLMQLDVVILGGIFISVMFMSASRVFSWTDLPDGPQRFAIGTIIKGFTLTSLIMLTAGLSYPFFRQGCSYRRIQKGLETGKKNKVGSEYIRKQEQKDG